MSVNYKLIKSSNAKQLLKDQMSFSDVLESEELKGDLDFEISYSVDPHTEKFDQTISKLSVGPIPKGNIGFNIETNPVKIELLKPEYIFGITSVIIVGKYKSNPFMRVGYILEVTYPNIDNKYLIKEDEIGEELDSEENTLEKSYECECEEDNCLCENEEDYEEENCECEGECECAEEYICECGNEECDCNECNCEGECDCMNEYVCECGNEDCNCNECNCEGECNCEENHECEDEKLCEEEDCNNILKEPLNKNEDCENREEIPKFNEEEMMEGSKKEADASKDNCENKEIIELDTNKQTEKINTEKGNECNQENLIKKIKLSSPHLPDPLTNISVESMINESSYSEIQKKLDEPLIPVFDLGEILEENKIVVNGITLDKTKIEIEFKEPPMVTMFDISWE